MSFFTADLCDNYCEQLEVLGPDFKSYGGTKKFQGEVVTVKLDKNNKDLAEYLKNSDGTGKIVVVDVGERYFGTGLSPPSPALPIKMPLPTAMVERRASRAWAGW